MPLLDALDLSVYDKDYAPFAERAAARARHLAQWPAAIEAGLASLDLLSAPVAQSMLGGVRGLAAGIPADADPSAREAALAAHSRLVARVQEAGASGDPDAALGAGRAERADGSQRGHPGRRGVAGPAGR